MEDSRFDFTVRAVQNTTLITRLMVRRQRCFAIAMSLTSMLSGG
jgi:hypothetical protein